jgi:hypothetical protein
MTAVTPGYALVTGASSGIGRALAVEGAGRGWAVCLVARDADRLEGIRRELPAPRQGSHEVLVADVATEAGIARVVERLTSLVDPIDLLITAAGVGTTAPFPRAPLAEEEMMLAVNVTSVLHLNHVAAAVMQARGAGAIINVSSTAAYWSAGTYAAAKSWVLAMTLGLRAQLALSGVRVMALVPGFTRTEFHARSRTDASGVRPWMWLSATDVAREALDALDRDRAVCIPGRRYRALVEGVRHLRPAGRAAVLRRLAPLRSAD